MSMQKIQRLAVATMACLSVFTLGGCQKSEEVGTVEYKLKHYKPGDWLHDIDAAVAIGESQKRGDFGPPSAALETKLGFVNQALKLSLTETSKCWPRHSNPAENVKAMRENELQGKPFPYQITTANTNHACLDAKGYKRSQ